MGEGEGEREVGEAKREGRRGEEVGLGLFMPTHIQYIPTINTYVHMYTCMCICLHNLPLSMSKYTHINVCLSLVPLYFGISIAPFLWTRACYTVCIRTLLPASLSPIEG